MKMFWLIALLSVSRVLSSPPSKFDHLPPSTWSLKSPHQQYQVYTTHDSRADSLPSFNGWLSSPQHEHSHSVPLDHDDAGPSRLDRERAKEDAFRSFARHVATKLGPHASSASVEKSIRKTVSEATMERIKQVWIQGDERAMEDIAEMFMEDRRVSEGFPERES
jgi:hypothetical protein